MADKRTTDRRILRTRSMIADALLELLKIKPYEEITIMDITKKADINRSTFYAHYLDKEDLLESMIGEKLEELAVLISNCSDPGGLLPSFNTPDIFYVTLFEHLSEHEQFYQVMLVKLEASAVRTKLLEIIKDGFYIRISKLDLSQKLQVPLDLLLDFISCSTLGIIMKWLADNRVYSPHYMALQLTRLSQLGIYKAMGLKEEKTKGI